MTAVVLTHPQDVAPRRLVVAPAVPGSGQAPSVVATLTVQVLLGDGDGQDPAAALRSWLEQLADACAVTVPRLRLVTTTTPTPDVQRLDADPGLGGVLVNVATHSVRSYGRPVELCRREYELLLFLAEHPRQVFTRGQLLAAVWADSFTGPRTVDVHVNRLRTKLGGPTELITTVRGVGYRLADDADVVIHRAITAGS
jgi:two-component system, OmpR family, response regulator MtrA